MDGKAAMIKKIQWAILETPETKKNEKFRKYIDFIYNQRKIPELKIKTEIEKLLDDLNAYQLKITEEGN